MFTLVLIYVIFVVTCHVIRRHLHETGYLKNITLDRDPRETDLNRCKYALHYMKGEAEKEIKMKILHTFGNCTIYEDKNIRNELQDLTIFSRFLAKENKLNLRKDVMEKIDDIIDKKCNGGF